VPIGLLVAAILQANNVRDIDNDRKHGKWTLAALAGRPIADYEYFALMLGGYAVVVAMTAFGTAPWPVLITLVTLPLAVRIVRFESLQRSPRGLNLVLAQTAGLHMLFGALLALGFALAVDWHGLTATDGCGFPRLDVEGAAIVTTKQAGGQPCVRPDETPDEFDIERAHGAVSEATFGTDRCAA